MLKSIAKDVVVESSLKLGKLKLSLADENKKGIEKTIAFLKKNLSDEELKSENLIDALVDFLNYDRELLSGVSKATEENIFKKTEMEKLNLVEIKDINLSSIERNCAVKSSTGRFAPRGTRTENHMIYLDLNGKLPKAKNGSGYRWREDGKGAFKIFDGKKLIASYKLYKEIEKRIDVELFAELQLKEYFKQIFFIGSKYGSNNSKNELILDAILDIFQDDISIQLMKDYETSQSGEYAKAFMTKKNISKSIMNRMEDNQFSKNGFNFIEFDNDTDLEKLEQVEKEWVNIFPSLPSVENNKTDLRFRKLGNYKASGVYFPTQHCIAIDLRIISSMIHEYGHLVDYQLNGQPISLTQDFREIVKSYSKEVSKLDEGYVVNKKNYYTTPTEVFARGFELYMNGKIETSFLKSEEDYSTLDEYTCFDEENRNRLEEFFNELFKQEKIIGVSDMGKNTNNAVMVDVTGEVEIKLIDMGEEIELDDMYEKINCRTVDIVRLPCDVDIWVDDEGLFRSESLVMNYKIRVEDGSYTNRQLAGNALFLSYNEEGDTVGLNTEQIDWIKENVIVTPYGITN